MNQIFVAKDYGQRGPFSEAEVYELLEQAEFSWDDLAWREGMEDWQPLRTVLKQEAAQGRVSEKAAARPVFHHVAPWKFVLMTLLTLGLYELYWFYKGWVFVKEEEGSRIWPFWRAFFAPVWLFPFAVRIFEREGRPRKPLAAMLLLAYLVTSSLWRLPGMYSFLAFSSVLVVLPLVMGVDRLNRKNGVVGPAYRRFGALHLFASSVGLLLLLLNLQMATLIFPPTHVLDGREIPQSHLEFMQEAEILPPGESIVYFYSNGIFSYKEDGNFFTGNRVVSYWQEAGELWMEEAVWDEIEEFSPTFASLEDPLTTIKVTRLDGSYFNLFVSSEGEGDRLFLEELVNCWKRAVGGR